MRFFAALIMLLAIGTAAEAGFLDFSLVPIQGQTSTLSYAGGLSPLIGTNLTVLSVTGQQTPLLDGVVVPLTNASVSFTTGNFIGFASNGAAEFAAGGTITYTGDLPGITTLYTGTFNAITFVTPIGNGFSVVDAAYNGLLNQTLATEFGLQSKGTETGALSILFNGSFTNGIENGFNSGNGTVNAPAVPEPSSFILVGLGLAAVGFYRRK